MSPSPEEIEASAGLTRYCLVTPNNVHDLRVLSENYGFYCKACEGSISGRLEIQVSEEFPIGFERQDDVTVKKWAKEKIEVIEDRGRR